MTAPSNPVLLWPSTLSVVSAAAVLHIMANLMKPLHPLLSQVELDSGMDLVAAHQQEAEFFQTTAPWCIEKDLQPRFGVPNLSQELSRQLVSLTRACLPEMKESLKKAVEELDKELSALPKALG